MEDINSRLESLSGSKSVRIVNFILCHKATLFVDGLYNIRGGGCSSLDYPTLPGLATAEALIQIFAEQWETDKPHVLKLKFSTPEAIVFEQEILKFVIPKGQAYLCHHEIFTVQSKEPGWHLMILTIDDKYSYEYPVLVRKV